MASLCSVTTDFVITDGTSSNLIKDEPKIEMNARVSSVLRWSTRVVYRKVQLRVWFNCVLALGSGAWRLTVGVTTFGPSADWLPARSLLLMFVLCTSSPPVLMVSVVLFNNQKTQLWHQFVHQCSTLSDSDCVSKSTSPSRETLLDVVAGLLALLHATQFWTDLHECTNGTFPILLDSSFHQCIYVYHRLASKHQVCR